MGRSGTAGSANSQAQASLKKTELPYNFAFYAYSGWRDEDTMVMAGWTKKVGSDHEFHVGLNDDINESPASGTRNQQTFHGVSASYTSLRDFSGAVYSTGEQQGGSCVDDTNQQCVCVLLLCI